MPRNLQPTAYPADSVVSDRQAESDAFRLCCPERIRQAFEVCGKPRTVVADIECCGFFVALQI